MSTSTKSLDRLRLTFARNDEQYNAVGLIDVLLDDVLDKLDVTFVPTITDARDDTLREYK